MPEGFYLVSLAKRRVLLLGSATSVIYVSYTPAAGKRHKADIVLLRHMYKHVYYVLSGPCVYTIVLHMTLAKQFQL